MVIWGIVTIQQAAPVSHIESHVDHTINPTWFPRGLRMPVERMKDILDDVSTW